MSVIVIRVKILGEMMKDSDFMEKTKDCKTVTDLIPIMIEYAKKKEIKVVEIAEK